MILHRELLDIIKGRRTEIDFLNGLVVEKGRAAGIDTPLNEVITALVKQIESGDRDPAPEIIDGL